MALWQLGERLDTGSGHIAPLFLAGCLIYGAIGFFARSGLVWLFFLLSLGNWFGAETGYVSGWGAYWLGIELPDPLRAVRRRAACALLRRATRFAPAPAVYRQ
ncbi:membrane protein [Klebsiella oxytoca]|nr:membrane protein [Klebsiella oxytoca]